MQLLFSPVEKPRDLVASDIHAKLVETSSFIRVVEARERYKVDGSGFTVAVLDTGLRTSHIDFKGKVIDQVNFTEDNKKDEKNATDGYGHGTNVGGIVVANGINRGIAPGANIIPVKVLNNKGGGDFNNIAKGLDYVLKHHKQFNITVVNLSVGNEGNYQNESLFSKTEIAQKIAQLNSLNIAVVVSAGNAFFQNKSEQGMSFPAIIRKCISVGAIYDSKGGKYSYASGAIAYNTVPGQITPFSQRLHDTKGGLFRTDIFSPGAPITSSGHMSDTAYSVQQGTSQAAPVVAGVILLMQEFYNKLSGDKNKDSISLPPISQLVEWLRDSAVSIIDGDDENDNVVNTTLAYKRVDAYEALRIIRKYFVKKIAFREEV